MFGLIYAAIIFAVLYIIAFLCNRDYREDDDVLWVSRKQWEGIIVMMIPLLIAFLKN